MSYESLLNKALRTLNIYQRINFVRSKIDYLKKDKQVEGQYMAVSHDAVTALVRGSMIEAGIVTVPRVEMATTVDTGTTTKRGTPIIRMEGTVVVRFVNEDVPHDYFEVSVAAHALDQGDKAPGKLLSYGVKYALLKVLMLETGEDDESRVEQEPAKVSEQQLLALTNLCEEYGWPAAETLQSLATKVFARLKLSGIADLPAEYFDTAVAQLRRKKDLEGDSGARNGTVVQGKGGEDNGKPVRGRTGKARDKAAPEPDSGTEG